MKKKEDTFELPVPLDAIDDELFSELEQSHREWLVGAVQKAPDEVLIAILMRAVAAGAILNDLSKEAFLDIAGKTYDHVVKTPKRSLAKEPGRG